MKDPYEDKTKATAAIDKALQEPSKITALQARQRQLMDEHLAAAKQRNERAAVEAARKTKPTGEHQYGERFALMWYACEAGRGSTFPGGKARKHCGYRERLWNSRNGVTPFGIRCTQCDGFMSHVDWHLDEYAPDHKPLPGSRFFRDGTTAEAITILEKRFKDRLDNPHAQAQMKRMRLEIEAGRIDEFRPGWPTIGTVPA